ncbi:MAG: hypothetical protein EBR83_05485, partial [Verrucomicrobia bacterium]|nr:hypothetical protein [Verrucomicrobiota bacterium]
SGVQFGQGAVAVAAFPEDLAAEQKSVRGLVEPVVLDELGGFGKIATEEVGLGRREPEVGLDLGRHFLVRHVLVRDRDQPRVLVEQEAAVDELAEVVAILLGELQGLLEQLIGVEGTLELEEQVRAQPLGFEVGRAELRAGADVLRELGVVLPGERGLGDADEVFAFAVEVRGASVRVLIPSRIG